MNRRESTPVDGNHPRFPSNPVDLRSTPPVFHLNDAPWSRILRSMKWSVLFAGVAKVLLCLIALMASFVAVIAHTFLALCLVLVAGLCLVVARKIRTRWLLAISGVLLVLLGSLILVTMNDLLKEAMALKIGNNGKNIVLAIISGSAERKAVGGSPLWPGVSADFSGATKNYAQAPDAETYFTDLVARPCMPYPLGWFHFAGAGVAAASNREDFLEGDRNVWNVVAGLDEDSSDATPFLFTRNLNITMDDLRNENVDLRTRLDARMKPFGREFVVVVRKGGAMEVLKRRRLTREAFLGGTVFNQTTNRHATVLKAKVRLEKTSQASWICSFCGETNLVEDICAGCVPGNPQEQVSKESTPGSSGRIEINRHHECTVSRHTLDLAMLGVVLAVCAIGFAAALLKNRRKLRG